MIKTIIPNIYELDVNDPTKVARQVKYLLEEDRFQCDPSGYAVGYNTSGARYFRV